MEDVGVVLCHGTSTVALVTHVANASRSSKVLSIPRCQNVYLVNGTKLFDPFVAQYPDSPASKCEKLKKLFYSDKQICSRRLSLRRCLSPTARKSPSPTDCSRCRGQFVRAVRGVGRVCIRIGLKFVFRLCILRLIGGTIPPGSFKTAGERAAGGISTPWTGHYGHQGSFDGAA